MNLICDECGNPYGYEAPRVCAMCTNEMTVDHFVLSSEEGSRCWDVCDRCQKTKRRKLKRWFEPA